MKITFNNFRCYDDKTFDFGEEGISLLSGPSGYGKCLGKDTLILLYDGTIKKVQDIKIGDKLMGDDSTPRTVLSTCKGVDTLYEIIPSKGKSYTVNSEHILTLKGDIPHYIYNERKNKWIVYYMVDSKKTSKHFEEQNDACEFYKSLEKEPINDICIKDYLKLGKTNQKYNYTYHTGVDFPEKDVILDPYLLGVWLGDGTSNIETILQKQSMTSKYFKEAKNTRRNYFIDSLKELNLWGNKYIPYIYKTNSRENRLKLLAGIIDTNGYVKNNMIEIVQKREQLARDIEYLALSLGFMAIFKQVNKTSRITGIYYKVNIFGENLNQIVKYKKLYPRYRANVHGFQVNNIGEGDYYGFEVDGNGRFLLSDFKVTHNSSVMIGIQFALFGTGTKVAKHGKLSCSVQLEFDGMKIYRTKRPNRVVVNDVHEDAVAQDIINKKFGDTFSTTGYISQNALNSFILMSPLDKLTFFEKFAFKESDLGKLKGRCKAHITDRHNILTGTISQLELATNFFSELEKPREMSFPIKCIPKNREKASKNEEVKLKNCCIIIRRLEKVIDKTKEELNDLRVLKASTNEKEENLSLLREKLSTLSVQEDENYYEGDDVLKDYENRLANIISLREITTLKKCLSDNLEKLLDMKEKEVEDYTEKLKGIEGTLWKEYSKDELESTIVDSKKYIVDMEKVFSWEKELGKYSSVNVEECEENKIELGKCRNDIESKRHILKCLKVQKELFSCPSCYKKLRFVDENLHLAEDIYDIDNVLDIDTLKREIDEIQKRIRILERVIPDDENKIERRKYLEKDIYNILSKYEERPDLEELQEDLEYLKEYKTSQLSLERKKTVLEDALQNEKFSSSYTSFKKTVLKQQMDLKELDKDIGKVEETLTEEKLRTFITDQQKYKERNTEFENRKNVIQDEIKTCERRLKTLKESHNEKYGEIREESDLSRIIRENEDLIVENKEKREKCDDTLEKIKEYERYEEENKNYMSWKMKVDDLSVIEREDRNKYASATMLYDKILEAESIAMHNIILSVNTHAQLYLDSFFPENPILVRLQSFKETKKSTKPQINIEIEYKGMECDLNMLSGGELSRVILAYTLALGEMFNTPLLLLDECTSSLDQNLTTVVFNAIRELYNGKLVILIAHQVITGIFDKTISLGNEECCH